MRLLSPENLDRTQIESIYARADEIAAGAPAQVQAATIALALFKSGFPLPTDCKSVLTDAGATVQTLTSPAHIKTAESDIILFSHPDTDSAAEYRRTTDASFLNAGDGTGENPVRALIDAHAIRALKGELSSIRVTILGNLKYSAEAHSLARLLGLFGTRLSFVTPAALSMPYDLTDQVRMSAYEVEETNDLVTTLRKTDALYLANIDATRVDKKTYDKLKNFYTLAPDTFPEAKDGLVILGEWEGGEELLSPTRRQVETSARAVLLALVEVARVGR
jgi:aspartate carbamoyltransferase catalytic subunit